MVPRASAGHGWYLIEGFTGLACPPNLPEIRIDIFQDVAPEILSKLMATQEPQSAEAPAGMDLIGSSIEDLDAILAG